MFSSTSGASDIRTPAKVLRDLPVLWKILVPFMALMLVLGWVGTFFIVRNLSSRAEVALDQDLGRRMLDVRASLQARELYLLESANLAANLQGMGAAARRDDRPAIAGLMRSVLALKTDVGFVGVVSSTGRALVGFERDAGGAPSASAPERWTQVASLAPRSDTEASAKLSQIDGKPLIVIAAPICSGTDRCERAGVVVVGIGVDVLARDAMTGSNNGVLLGGIALFDERGARLAGQGDATPAHLRVGAGTTLERRTEAIGGGEVVTLVAPFEIQDREIGFAAVTLPKDPAYASVRGTGNRLALILLSAMLGVVALGALLSRFILAQVRPLVLTNRALEQGVLSARTPVLGDDELGELARGINRMAESLQESHESLQQSHETLESKVNERTLEIERLLHERSDFFASLSHELRTPLAVILVKTDLLLESAAGATSGKVRDLSTTIRYSADQVLSVINEILDLAKAEGGHLDVVIEDVALDGILDELGGTIDSLARAAGLTASVELPSGVAHIRADRAHLRKIILNLVDNAAKYTPAGGHIAVTVATRADTVEISVADTGVGIPTGARERVFDPFYRVEGTRSQRGQASTGLGLALAKRLVDAQDGSIRFTSRPGRGSTFTVTLPRAAKIPATVTA